MLFQVVTKFNYFLKEKQKNFCMTLRKCNSLWLETFVPEAIEGMVQMQLWARNSVSLIWIAQLIEKNVVKLQSSGEHHWLLIMHIVVGVAMNQEEIMLADNFHVFFGGHVAGYVAVIK